jgi:hypothetical protein
MIDRVQFMRYGPLVANQQGDARRPQRHWLLSVAMVVYLQMADLLAILY